MTRKVPKLSIVVVVYNMQREAPRTLYSLSAEFQRGVESSDYEVIVIDNGSAVPLDQTAMPWCNFHYHRIADASPSPASAINYGASLCDADAIGIMIDGARIASPGVVFSALSALEQFKRVVVSTIGLHLGPDIQTKSILNGYNRDVEDELLAGIDWQNHGYRLFDICAFAGSSQSAWLGRIPESNLVFMPLPMFHELGGYDERFDIPGGGIVNLDFYKRACDLPDATLVTLFGEATFHQVHGGIMTNRPDPDVGKEVELYKEQYYQIKGEPYAPSIRMPMLLGFPNPTNFQGMIRAAALIAGIFVDSVD